MPERILKTNGEILDRMAKIVEQQNVLILLFRETNDKKHLEAFELLSQEFQQLRKALREPNIEGFSDWTVSYFLPTFRPVRNKIPGREGAV